MCTYAAQNTLVVEARILYLILKFMCVPVRGAFTLATISSSRR